MRFRPYISTLSLAVPLLMASFVPIFVFASFSAQTAACASPTNIPVGSASVLLTVSQTAFPQSGSVRVDGTNVSFRSHRRYVEILLPETLLDRERTVSLEFRKSEDAEPMRCGIKVVARKFKASVILSIDRTKVSPTDSIAISIGIRNDGSSPFYVPSDVNPFNVGSDLSAFAFELFASETSVPFPAILAEVQGGVQRPTASEYLAAGEIVRLDPDYYYQRTIKTQMNTLGSYMERSGQPLKQGIYRLRVKYYGLKPHVELPPAVPFLNELLFSNEVVIQII